MILKYQNKGFSKFQTGVGLLEVLISLLLLGIAVLGYAALQGQSLKTTDESLTRTQSIALLRATTERIRTNALGSTYTLIVNENANSDDIGTVLNQYQTNFDLTAPPAQIACPDSGCTPMQMAINDVREMRLAAEIYDIKLGMVTCPGTNAGESTFCLIAAWNNTNATKGTSNTDCMKDNGAYRLGADCIYMEAY